MLADAYMYKYVWKCVFACVWLYELMDLCIDTYNLQDSSFVWYVCMYACMYVYYVCVCVYLYTYVCKCMRLYVYVCTYVLMMSHAHYSMLECASMMHENGKKENTDTLKLWIFGFQTYAKWCLLRPLTWHPVAHLPDRLFQLGVRTTRSGLGHWFLFSQIRVLHSSNSDGRVSVCCHRWDGVFSLLLATANTGTMEPCHWWELPLTSMPWYKKNGLPWLRPTQMVSTRHMYPKSWGTSERMLHSTQEIFVLTWWKL